MKDVDWDIRDEAAPLAVIYDWMVNQRRPSLAWIIHWSFNGEDPFQYLWQHSQDGHWMWAILRELPNEQWGSTVDRVFLAALEQNVVGPDWDMRAAADVIRSVLPNPPTLTELLALHDSQ